MLRTRPDLGPLMLQLLLIIVLMPLQVCLSAFYNIYVTCRHCRLPKHDWAPSLVPCLLDIKLNDQYEWPDETRACTSTQALLDLFRVPLVKRAVSVLSHVDLHPPLLRGRAPAPLRPAQRLARSSSPSGSSTSPPSS